METEVKLSESRRGATVRVLTNDPHAPELTCRIKAGVLLPFRLTPLVLDFGTVLKGTECTDKVVLFRTAAAHQNFRLKVTSEHIRVAPEMIKIPTGEKGEVSISLKSSAPFGRNRWSLEVSCEGDGDRRAFAICANVVHALLVAPQSLVISEARTGASRDHGFVISSYDGKPLAAPLRVEAPKWLKVDESSTKPYVFRHFAVSGMADATGQREGRIRVFFPNVRDPAEIPVKLESSTMVH